MTEFTAVPVASGVPYHVIHVSDLTPTNLQDFVGRHSITIRTNTAEVLWIPGQGVVDDYSVKFYEKGRGGVGKDIPVWHISAAGDGTSFFAEHVSSA
jgi:hypothetical protein